ncbi:DUF6207 family protein [Streptomyces sp. SID685]|uniref:DUF6207 family protein n=1 Tax=Streptomyces sp. SID685 TaxID=2690322 RepID=UPI0031FF2E2C
MSRLRRWPHLFSYGDAELCVCRCRRVVDVAAGDDETAHAFQEAVAARWATAVADCTTREPGRPGVRLRCYVDLRQSLDVQAP